MWEQHCICIMWLVYGFEWSLPPHSCSWHGPVPGLMRRTRGKTLLVLSVKRCDAVYVCVLSAIRDQLVPYYCNIYCCKEEEMMNNAQPWFFFLLVRLPLFYDSSSSFWCRWGRRGRGAVCGQRWSSGCRPTPSLSTPSCVCRPALQFANCIQKQIAKANVLVGFLHLLASTYDSPCHDPPLSDCCCSILIRVVSGLWLSLIDQGLIS